MKLFVISLPLFLVVFANVGLVQAQENSTSSTTGSCNKNGGVSVVWAAGCYARNNTFSEQCILDESTAPETGNPTRCSVTAKEGGCKIYYTDETTGVVSSSSVGSGSIKGCDNACVDISSDVPSGSGTTCQSSGSGMSFEGSCDSRGYTWTPQCSFEETNGECRISANACGCLYWEEDSPYVNGINGKNNCDSCSAGSGSGAAVPSAVAAAVAIAASVAVALGY